MIWFTSDQHLGHSNIIKYCFRPFGSKDEMDDIIVNNWNSKVKESDTVFCAGDLLAADNNSRAMAKISTVSLLSRLSGKIILIKGDHDYCSVKHFPERFESIHDYYFLKPGNGIEIALFHWPIVRWQKSHYNTWHLHGHCHGKFQNQGKSLDVGADVHNFFPISLDEVSEIMKLKPDNENKLTEETGKSLELEQLSLAFQW